jgi:hypothetical protein
MHVTSQAQLWSCKKPQVIKLSTTIAAGQSMSDSAKQNQCGFPNRRDGSCKALYMLPSCKTTSIATSNVLTHAALQNITTTTQRWRKRMSTRPAVNLSRMVKQTSSHGDRSTCFQPSSVCWTAGPNTHCWCGNHLSLPTCAGRRAVTVAHAGSVQHVVVHDGLSSKRHSHAARAAIPAAVCARRASCTSVRRLLTRRASAH